MEVYLPKLEKIYQKFSGYLLIMDMKIKGIESILINEMLIKLYNEFGSMDEIVYFIDENCTNELKSALDAGFMIKDIYKCIL